MEMRGSKIALRNRETISRYLANEKEKIRKVCGGGCDQRRGDTIVGTLPLSAGD